MSTEMLAPPAPGGGIALTRVVMLAMRELRSGLRGFYIFIACVALGVMVITGVGALSDALRGGFERQGEAILGGDVTFGRMHVRAAGREREWLAAQGRMSETATLRAMARRADGEEQALVEIKAVDEHYPLAGEVRVGGAASLEQANAFWRLREAIVEVQKYPGGSIKHDISVPVAAVPDFIAEASAAVTALTPGARPIPFGHLGDGNVHFNVTQPAGADKAAYLARWAEMNAVVHAIAAKLGGSISAEHGIGRLKRELLPGVKDPVALEMMRALKRTLDPKGILNPGKVL